ncbi:MAG: hypothetical protein ACLT4C_05420 [Butyricicoccus sp.]
MNQRFMREKPILPLLLSMALPMVVSMLVNSLYNIIDSLFVAKIGGCDNSAVTGLSGTEFDKRARYRLRRGH